MEFTFIYWINESMHAIRYTYSKYACTRLPRTKRDTNWTKTPIKPRKHTQVWQEQELSKLYQNSNQHMIEGTTLKRCQMKVRYQLMKISSRNKPNPLHFSWWHKVPRREMFVFQRDTSSGSNTNWRQLMFTKHIGLLPQDLCIIYELAFEYKMHSN